MAAASPSIAAGSRPLRLPRRTACGGRGEEPRRPVAAARRGVFAGGVCPILRRLEAGGPWRRLAVAAGAAGPVRVTSDGRQRPFAGDRRPRTPAWIKAIASGWRSPSRRAMWRPGAPHALVGRPGEEGRMGRANRRRAPLEDAACAIENRSICGSLSGRLTRRGPLKCRSSADGPRLAV